MLMHQDPLLVSFFASGTLPQTDSSSGSFIQYCQMLYLSATTVPLVNPFCFCRCGKQIKVTSFCVAVRFLSTVSLHEKGSMDRTSVFPFVSVLYEEHNNQSTTDGYKFHSCFLIIANWNTNDGWLFVYLCTQLNETKRKKNKDGIYKRSCFSVVPFSTLRIEKTKICITDHILLSFSVYESGKRKMKLYYLFPIFFIMVSENE